MEGVSLPPSGAPVDPQYAPPSHSDHVKHGSNAAQGSDQSQTQSTDKTDYKEKTDTGSSDTTFRDVTEEEEGQGGGGSGAGDSSTGDQGSRQGSQAESQIQLKDEFGTSNVIDGVTINSAQGTQKAQTSTDAISKSSQIALISIPLATSSPAHPLLAKPANFDAMAVLQQVKGNPWFNTTFLTKITMNMMSLIEIQSKIQQAELKIAVLMMEFTVLQAHVTGDLIMAAAQKEAQMYMTMAIASIVSLAVGAVGAGLSGVGKLKAAMKGAKLKELKQGKPLKEEPGKMKGELGGAETTSVTKAKKAPKLDEETPAKDKPAEAGADVSNAEAIKTEQKARKEEKAAVAKTDAKIDESKTEAKKSADEETPVRQKADIEEITKTMKKRAYYEAMGDFGSAMVQTNSALNSAMTNFIQMIYKPQIAEFERAKTLSEARSRIIGTVLDFASQAFNTASQIIDSAIQELQKIQDESSRANDMKG